VAAAHDYEVNLKSELEILALHQKVDALRERQWSELVAMQQEQIRLPGRLRAGGRALLAGLGAGGVGRTEAQAYRFHPPAPSAGTRPCRGGTSAPACS
jgi:hypothetical protein